ncbi:GMC family oxidoreductase [Sulfuriflexus sp.]|uniref:GMC family oxidoreductase n=1 Tax=Sulfuriflexus sp. TaxID=2015443 RepID=UPI0028CF991F|nr:GMC family oxidoreductase [Sulfuriflexus sp.]MDT8404161.1 GMC family oxidoreductase [Sulfuriflexus sp.]
MSKVYDVCIVGSGAGGGPVALTLAEAGYSVLVLEKGPWFREEDFYKDELACCRRSVYTPKLQDEQHVIEDTGRDGWEATPTAESGWDFWNGNCVGGASNFMSGFFYRLKPEDFHLHASFGEIEGANVADWPIRYADLEPYYTKAETEVGISGRVVGHPLAEPRSTPDFPYPPTREHPIAERIDQACADLKFHSLPTPRAILPHTDKGRRGCEYSGYCGSYGCSSGAKGSSRAALLNRAVASGRCEIRPHAKVYHLGSDQDGRVTAAHYFDQDDNRQTVSAKLFVVACHAIETSRLLLLSKGPRHPDGLGNQHGQVGKNLVFSAGSTGSGDFVYSKLDKKEAALMKTRGPFVNRGLQDWYFIENSRLGPRVKGGTIDFLLRHPNVLSRANAQKWDADDKLVWGKALQDNIKSALGSVQTLRFEVFCDWLPNDDCFVSLDPKVKDKWGTPVARVRIGYHEHDLKVAEFLTGKAEQVLQQMGAENIRSSVSGSPPANLVAGGCRFGHDPKTSVLNADCQVHSADNLYVTDGSFMPTGGSVPFTWTIYANAFRVADKIMQRLSERA